MLSATPSARCSRRSGPARVGPAAVGSGQHRDGRIGPTGPTTKPVPICSARRQHGTPPINPPTERTPTSRWGILMTTPDPNRHHPVDLNKPDTSGLSPTGRGRIPQTSGYPPVPGYPQTPDYSQGYPPYPPRIPGDLRVSAAAGRSIRRRPARLRSRAAIRRHLSRRIRPTGLWPACLRPAVRRRISGSAERPRHGGTGPRHHRRRAQLDRLGRHHPGDPGDHLRQRRSRPGQARRGH